MRGAATAIVLLAGMALSAEARAEGPAVIVGADGRPVAAAPVGLRVAVADGRGGWFAVRGTAPARPIQTLVHVRRDGRVDRGWGGSGGTWRVNMATRLARAGDVLLAAGRFRLGARLFVGVLAVDVLTGRLLDSPRVQLTGDVTALAASHSRLYIAHAAPDGGPCLDAFDLRTGLPLRAWRADLRWTAGYGCVDELMVDPRRVYAAGGFVRGDSSARRGLIALDARTGAPIHGFRTRVSGGPGQVLTLARAHGRVYVGGNFARVNGVPRSGLAAVDAVTGRVIRSWRADLRP